ncbi:glucan endo-1,3-beta-glucosidase-like [Vitis vinifera]|nr:glucan endo-1,3-beta-glucosidase-like [Vitis vinifera]
MGIQPFLFSVFLLLLHSTAAAPVGICYGIVANNLPPASNVVNLLKSNGISNIRLFNADPDTLKPFSGTGIQLMIGVPNEVLPSLATGTVNVSLDWLQSNIFAYVSSDQVRYIAVGNEVFLKDPFYTPYVLPSIISLYQALQILGLADKIKVSSPHAASVLSSSSPPSTGTFDPYLRSVMVPYLQFLEDHGSPFLLNVYPYISYIRNKQYISLDYALFGSGTTVQDGALTYTNLFDASVDAFVWAMEREGFGGVAVVVAETGWPRDGGDAATPENALAYNNNVIRRARNSVGTPKRPGVGVEVFVFDLFDENLKSGDEYERHFGIFGLDGAKAYDLSFN